ncbi:MAG: sigma-70 family RNA polymerase sigma factor [Deltaproteobacteria bacterium]|nr:sigma-70 family RNA polymerase sigma factor [Deltaproteobacteria bacterium]
MEQSFINQEVFKLSKGELASFSDLYYQYKDLIRGVLFRLTPFDQIDDLAQETFLKIWKGLPGFQGKSSLRVWIYRIAYHVAVDALKKRKAIREVASCEETGTSFESQWMNQKLVRKILKELPLENRSVLVLFFMEELSLEEISETLEIPTGTVKSRLHYSKQKMLETLGKEGIEL